MAAALKGCVASAMRRQDAVASEAGTLGARRLQRGFGACRDHVVPHRVANKCLAAMGPWQGVAFAIMGLLLAACTTDPNARVNQAFPVRQMDAFFNGLSTPPVAPAPTDYTHAPGYAPAYPPYADGP